MTRSIGISLVVLSCLQLIVLAWIARTGTQGPDDPVWSARADPPDILRGEPAAMTAALSRLADELEARAERPAALVAPPGDPTRRPMTPEWAASLQESLKQLRVAIDRLALTPSAVAPSEAARAPDWVQLGQVRESLIRDRDAERKKLLLTPVRAVLRRFGKPTEVHLDKRGRQVWHYQRQQPGNPTATEDLFVAMNDGVVVSVFESW